MASENVARSSTNKKRFGTLLGNRNFMLLCSGQTISWFGDSLYFLSLLWLVQDMTGSKAMMGLVAACRSIPVLLGFLAGSLVDRLDKKKSMVAVSITQACVIGSIPLLKTLGLLQAWQIPVVAFLLASLGTFFIPARSALVPHLVRNDELVQANSLLTMSQQMVFIAGYSIGGILIKTMGIMFLFWLDAASFLAVSTGIWLMRLPSRDASHARSQVSAATFVSDIKAGLGFVLNNKTIAVIMPLSILLNFVLAPVSVFMPGWVKDVLCRGPEVLGFIETGILAGMVVGSAAVAVIVQRMRVSSLLPASVVMMGIAFFCFSLSRSVTLAIAAMSVFGLANGFCNVVFNAYLQSIVPKNMMGRVFGMIGTIGQIAAPVGQGLGGMLASAFPLPLLLGAQGIIITVASLAYWINPTGREAFRMADAGLSRG